MALCEKHGDCPFYQNKMMCSSDVFDKNKELYCKNTFEICARYKVSVQLGDHYIPIDMFPDETDRAESLIKVATGF